MSANDILDVDLSSLDTSFPVVTAGLYDLRVTKLEMKENESKTMMVCLETTTVSTSITGDNLSTGIGVFDNLNTVPTGKSTKEIVSRNLAGFVQAFGDVAKGWTLRDLLARRTELMGQTVRARVGIQPAGPDGKGIFRRARNTVDEYLKP